jgi:hypothetical protein
LDWDGSTKHPAGLRLADMKSFRLMALPLVFGIVPAVPDRISPPRRSIPAWARRGQLERARPGVSRLQSDTMLHLHFRRNTLPIGRGVHHGAPHLLHIRRARVVPGATIDPLLAHPRSNGVT